MTTTKRFFVKAETPAARNRMTQWLDARGYFPYAVTGLEVEVPDFEVLVAACGFEGISRAPR